MLVESWNGCGEEGETGMRVHTDRDSCSGTGTSARLLPGEFRQLVLQVVMVQADLESELVFDSSMLRSHILAAPDARGRMRMAKFFAEEVNHGYTFWRIAKGLGVELTARYFRETKRKRQ